MVVPIKDHNDRVFGVLAVDTVNDPRNITHDAPVSFTPHEVHFYQVMVPCFKNYLIFFVAFGNVCMESLLHICRNYII